MIPEATSAAMQTDRDAWEKTLPELMVRYQAGDSGAVDELVKQLSGMLMQFLAAFGLSKTDTEDLFQDCWMRIHGSRNTYRPTEPVLPWIFAIARHTRLDGYRRRRRRESREVLVASPPEAYSYAPPTSALDWQDFDQLLEGLPPPQREVIFMLKVSGMSLEEVARATSSTVGAIKQKAHRAYEKLRLALEKERI